MIIRGLRWWMAGLVFLATFINFIDRLTIAVLAPVIIVQLGLTNLEFASISTWFLVAYTASQGLSGRIYDRVGTRRGFTMSIVIWSAAAMAHAFASGLASLSALRFVLGLGEAGNWPGAAKVIAEWFPARQRAFAMGIFNSGVTVGSIVAPPLIVYLQLRFGWQTTFLVTGGLGFVWLALWLLFYDTPERHTALSRAELAVIREDRGPSAAQGRVRWTSLLARRQVWAIVASRFITDPVWWLYITWLPLYLVTVRGFSLKQIGLFAWLPYVAADLGSLIGGWLSGHLIARGWTANRARKTIIAIGAVLMMAGIPAAMSASAMAALAFISVVLFGFQVWINNVQTMPSDCFPESVVASVAGLGGVGAGCGAILFTLTTGFVVDHLHSYTPILVVAGLLPILGTTVLFAVGGPIRRIPLDQEGDVPA
ncbi:MAG: MFS transporter [Acidobacteria bacterium]|nr:MFS transporter [Acidobacteriota bacterium]